MAKKDHTNAEDFDIIYVDADMARTWLAANEGNRRLSMNDCRRYAASMLAKTWVLGNDALMFNRRRQLHNGQHRLTALVMASEVDPNIRVPFLVRWNTDDDEFDHVDQGKIRTAADVMSSAPIAWKITESHAAAIARVVIQYDTLPDVVWSTTTQSVRGVNRDKIVEWARKHQDQIEGSYHRVSAPMKNTPYNALRYIVRRDSKHSDDLDEFCEGLTTGAGLSVGDPRLTLRNYLSGDAWRGTQWGSGQSMLGHHILTWNKWVKDENSKIMRFRRDQLPMPRVL